MTREELAIDRIKKAGFDDEEMNRLAASTPFDVHAVLRQAEILMLRGDQAPNDAMRAQMLVEFIEEKLSEIIEPSESDEERAERLKEAVQERGPRLDHAFMRKLV